jgi:hypothetical protein
MTLRAQMLAIPRRREQVQAVTAWLEQHLPDFAFSFMWLGDDRLYFMFPSDSEITAAPPIDDFEVKSFSDPAQGMAWVNDDIKFRRMAPAGRPC